MRAWVSIALVAAAIVLLWTAGGRHEALLEMREAYGMDVSQPLEDAPPAMVFTTIVLGGFRGLLADILWLRVSYLQDSARYFELVQLADWITKLEPRCTDIWAFHAWNMSYNVSVMMPDVESRWRWVRNGVRLLRDEGVRYNPGDPKLYAELAWLFAHKIGHVADAANVYYKRRWADEMTELFGPDGMTYGSPEPDDAAGIRKFEEHRLDPRVLREVDARYGPLDWRLANSHAVYWAHRGNSHAPGRHDLRCDRVLYQSLSSSFYQGSVEIGPEPDRYLTTPRLDLFPQVCRAYEDAIAAHKLDSVREAYHNYLTDAVPVLYLFNRMAAARAALDNLGTRFMGAPAGTLSLEDFVGAETGAMASEGAQHKTSALVQGLLYRSFLLLASGDAAASREAAEAAGQTWHAYEQSKPPALRVEQGIPEFGELWRLAVARARAEFPAELSDALAAAQAAGTP